MPIQTTSLIVHELCGNDNRNLAGFLKTNLAKFASYLSEKGAAKKSDKTENHTNKGKEKEKDGKRRERSGGYTLTFCIGYVGDGF